MEKNMNFILIGLLARGTIISEIILLREILPLILIGFLSKEDLIVLN
jgi:hypothetical protein